MSKNLDGLLGLWTTREMAAILKVSDTELSRWRRGNRRPKPQRIRQIGDMLAILRAQDGKPSNDEIAAARREVAAAIAADAEDRRRK